MMRKLLSNLYLHIFPAATIIMILIYCTSIYSQEPTAAPGNKDPYDRALYFIEYAKYDSAVFFFKKAIERHDHKNSRDRYLQSIVQLAETYRIIRQLDSAGFYIGLAHEKAAQYAAPGDLIFADIYQVSGAIALSSGNYPQAKDELNRSITIRKSITGLQDTSLAYAYNKLGNYYWFTNNYDSAPICYRQALHLALLKHNQNNKESASYYQNIGLIYNTTGLYSEAEVYLKKSLEIKHIVLSEDDLSLANSYNNLGHFYYQTSKSDKAYEYYKISEEIYLKHFDKDHYNLAWIYIQQGNCFLAMGDNENALIYYFKARSIYEHDYYANRKDIMRLAMNIGLIYEKMGLYDDAIKYYLESADNKTDPAIIKTYRNLANVYVKLGEYDKADHYYKLSIAESIRFFGNESIDLALSYRYFGNFVITVLNDDTGLQYYQKALDILVKLFGEKNRDVADVMTFTGDYYLGKKMYDTALAWYQQSLVSAITVFDDLSISKNPGIRDLDPDPYILRYTIHKADALLQYYFNETHNTEDLKLSLQTYKLATQLIDKIRSEYVAEGSKLYLTNAVYKVYNNIIILLDELYALTNDPALLSESFEYAEKEKSAVLLGVLRDADARISGNIPGRYLEQEKGLKIEINTYNSLLKDESHKKTPDKKKTRLWRDKLFELKLQHDSLISFFEEAFPTYYSLKYSDEIITPEKIKSLLKDDEALIEYSITDSVLFTYLVSDREFRVFSSPIDSAFPENINILRDCFVQQGTINFDSADFRNFVVASEYLYEALLGPVSNFIEAKRLIIIPDGELHYLSFDILLTDADNTDKYGYKGLSYLLLKNPVNYVASATILFSELQKKERPGKNNILAFAPSYDNIFQVSRNLEMGENEARDLLYPIPFAREEVNSIFGYFNGMKFTGREAREIYFKAHAPDFSILHLAMHTIIDDKNPMFSKLVFFQDNDTIDNGLLHTYELFNMELNGELAVLSACNTGSGKLAHGEGVMSLARGFMYAGIPSLVMTLWTVEDQAGAGLMNNFYRNLESGMQKDVALNKAKIEYLDASSKLMAHPYFWAGYVSIGNTRALKTSPGIFIYLGTGIVLAMTLLFVFIYIKKSSRSNKGRVMK